MHEIDPKSEVHLTDALRRLAASSPQAAPPELGDGLMNAFRRHHTRRKRIRQAGIGGLLVCLVLVTALIAVRNPGKKAREMAAAPTPAPTKQSQDRPAEAVTAPAIASAAQRPAVRPVTKTGRVARPPAASRAFLALPGYDPAVPMDELNVVRVRLPESALWKLGAPVGANAGARPMTADFVVSQDGTPYAVRLVQ